MANVSLQQLVQQIWSLIDSGDIVINGKLITERKLAIKLNINRSQLRQALNQLEESGIITRKQGSGTYIGAPKVNDLAYLSSIGDHISNKEIIEVRLELEPVMAFYAAKNVTPAQLFDIEQALDLTASAKNAKEYEQFDGLFHRAIAKATNNNLFFATFDAIWQVRQQAVWTKRREIQFSKDYQLSLVKQHQQIYLAISTQDQNLAKSKMYEHIVWVANKMLS